MRRKSLFLRVFPALQDAAVRAARRHSPQHVSQRAESPRRSPPPARFAPRLRFAGQITGCEGYVESAAIGLIAGRMAAAERLAARRSACRLPRRPIGALINHITGGHIESIDAGPQSFQPMNVNFGLFPPLIEPVVGPPGTRLRGPEKGRRPQEDVERARRPRSRNLARRGGGAGRRLVRATLQKGVIPNRAKRRSGTGVFERRALRHRTSGSPSAPRRHAPLDKDSLTQTTCARRLRRPGAVRAAAGRTRFRPRSRRFRSRVRSVRRKRP